METVGGTERPEVDGSTDEFGWFAPREIESLRLADIVERALGREDHGR
jgi:hypothetical protein